MKRKSKKILYISIFLVIVLIIAIPKLTFLRGEAKQDRPGGGQRIGGGSLPVKVKIVNESGLVDKIYTSGTILADEEVELKSEISGKIVKIYFIEGSRVNKGDLLIKTNDSELKAQLLKANYRKKLAEEKEERYKAMMEKDAVSKEEYDVSLNELNTINADIQLIEAQIDKTEIKAPFSGIIGLKSVSEGSYLSPNVSIASLQNISRIKIDFSIPEKYSGIIKDGRQISFKMQGNNNQYTGTVYAVEPKIDRETRTLKVRAISSNIKSEIYPGAFAEIELSLQEIDKAILIPTEAVVPDIEGQKVFLFNQGKAVSVAIETGIRREGLVQIIKGIQPGDTLITSGIMQIRPGMPVKIAEVL